MLRRVNTGNVLMDDGRPLESYLLDGWEWNKAKYRAENRPLQDLVTSFINVHFNLPSLQDLSVEGCVQDMNGIDAIQKQKTNNYNLARGQLQSLQRRQTYVCPRLTFLCA